MEKTFMEAMDFRHACKIFDETKKLVSDDIKYILKQEENLLVHLDKSLGNF